jgi:esterase/lipase
MALNAMTCPAFAVCVPSIRKRGDKHPDHVAYDRYPSRATGEFFKMVRGVRNLPKSEAPPTLVCCSEADDLADPKSALFLAERLLNPLTRTVRLERSWHILTVGVEKEALFDEMRSFYREITPLRQGDVRLDPN